MCRNGARFQTGKRIMKPRAERVSFRHEPPRPIPTLLRTRDNSEGRFRLEPALGVWSKTTLKSLLVPGGILLPGVAVLLYSGWLTLLLPSLSFLYYCALVGGMLLAWRFHSEPHLYLRWWCCFWRKRRLPLFGGGHISPGTPRVDRRAGRRHPGASGFCSHRADA